MTRISIHAPRVGSDAGFDGQPGCDSTNFYPRSPRGERRLSIFRPARAFYFYPRSPRGERHLATRKQNYLCGISIHAPRVGSDEDHKRP